jgi:hypothetical protein
MKHRRPKLLRSLLVELRIHRPFRPQNVRRHLNLKIVSQHPLKFQSSFHQTTWPRCALPCYNTSPEPIQTLQSIIGSIMVVGFSRLIWFISLSYGVRVICYEASIRQWPDLLRHREVVVYMRHCEWAFQRFGIAASGWLSTREHWCAWLDRFKSGGGKQAPWAHRVTFSFLLFQQDSFL